MKQVVIFIAPPGAGKGTQSDVLAKKFGFLHLETAKIIEEKFAKATPADADINAEKQNFLTGKLVTPEKVTAWVIEKIRELAAKEISIVFSGSFRTMYEAQEEVVVIEELYGRDNVTIFFIALDEEESVRRNSQRRICEKNRHPIPAGASDEVCPLDGSRLIKRELDTPDVIRNRYREYMNRTKPVLDFFKQNGYAIIEINGKQSIEHVTRDILQNFKAS